MKRAAPWLVLIVLLLAAGAWFVLYRQPPEIHPSVVDLPEIAPAPPPAEFPVEDILPAPAPQMPSEPLPGLAESDAVLREELATLLGPEALDAYFVPEQLVNRIVATVDSLTSREIAPLVLPLKPAGGAFLVVADQDTFTISPANAARYAPYARLAEAVDTAQAAALYVRFYPLFQEAYVALGYPDGHFNDRLVEVLDHLLDTPSAGPPARLVKPEAVYVYQDEALEAQSAGRKLLLRMGDENAAAVLGKLREFRAAIAGARP